MLRQANCAAVGLLCSQAANRLPLWPCWQVLLVVRVVLAFLSGSLSMLVATLDAVLDVVSSGARLGGGGCTRVGG